MSQLVEERQSIARRSDLKGSERRALLSDATDSWLRGLLTDAIAQHGADPAQFALLAVGGYGRREMSLGSDIDVVLVHEPSALRVEDVASSLWYPIWDSKIALDHSVRTIAQARTLARDDFKVVLGLIDARVVAGSTELGESLRTGILGDWRASAGDRLVELHATAMARRSRVGDLAQLLEPDVKEAYGGLRDVVLLRALAASWTVEVPRTEWPTAVSTLSGRARHPARQRPARSPGHAGTRRHRRGDDRAPGGRGDGGRSPADGVLGGTRHRLRERCRVVPGTAGNAEASIAGTAGAAAIDTSVRLTVEGPRACSLGGGGCARRRRGRAGAWCFTGERSRFAVAGRRRCRASIRHAGAVHGGASLAMPSDPRTVE